MAKKKAENQVVSDYLAGIGSRGGKAKVPKGFSTMDPKRHAEIAKKAAAKRWGKKKKAGK